MIKSDWIVGARLNYEARHSLVISRRSRPQLGGHGRARARAFARERRREVLIPVNAPLLVA